MNNVIELRKGSVYFFAAFFDEVLQFPAIDTYIYDGSDADSYFFRSAADQTEIIRFQKSEIQCVYDHKALSAWLLEDHNPREPMKIEYEYREV